MSGLRRAVCARQVHDQLPRQLQEKFWVVIEGDPFGLNSKAVLRKIDFNVPSLTGNKIYETPLLTTVVDGLIQFTALPDEFLALLCLVE